MGQRRERAPVLRVVARRRTGVRELSGVAVAPDGRVFVVDDEFGLAELPPRGRSRLVGHCGLAGIEGVAVSSDGRRLFVVSEDSRRIHRIPILGDGSLGAPVKVGRLPKNRTKNKGWEGIAWLPKEKNPERRDRLVLVREGRPRRVALFDPEDLDDRIVLRLPKELKRGLRDLSDVAVEPRTGALYLLSDASSAIGVATLRRSGGAKLALDAVRVLPLPLRGTQAEGIAFDGRRRLYVASERDGLLLVLQLAGR